MNIEEGFPQDFREKTSHNTYGVRRKQLEKDSEQYCPDIYHLYGGQEVQ